MFGKLPRWLKFFVTAVPESVAVCEFECHETECEFGDWQQCPRRREVQDLQRSEDRLTPPR